jgi:hypothetical protein
VEYLGRPCTRIARCPNIRFDAPLVSPPLHATLISFLLTPSHLDPCAVIAVSMRRALTPDPTGFVDSSSVRVELRSDESPLILPELFDREQRPSRQPEKVISSALDMLHKGRADYLLWYMDIEMVSTKGDSGR